MVKQGLLSCLRPGCVPGFMASVDRGESNGGWASCAEQQPQRPHNKGHSISLSIQEEAAASEMMISGFDKE